MLWRRYVAIGDSTTEGLDDPDGAGGYRGWADRFALALARAQGGLAYTAGLPSYDDSWSRPLPAAIPRPRHEVVRAELAWTRRHLLPWLARHLHGRSSGDDRVAKRPVPLPVELPPA
ncbi:hypothetical protein ONA91_05570 [Micromonospora sp. DR5-3]|nr:MULTISPECIES: hypothetical protein [unclassified Micromonospora]MCW3813923.1 hypothetical protein [Micromonospora sp. DR5-3]TYC24535.1 hypothetical protein FXF52_09720 [Micromonospora sp. MP36]